MKEPPKRPRGRPPLSKSAKSSSSLGKAKGANKNSSNGAPKSDKQSIVVKQKSSKKIIVTNSAAISSGKKEKGALKSSGSKTSSSSKGSDAKGQKTAKDNTSAGGNSKGSNISSKSIPPPPARKHKQKTVSIAATSLLPLQLPPLLLGQPMLFPTSTIPSVAAVAAVSNPMTIERRTAKADYDYPSKIAKLSVTETARRVLSVLMTNDPLTLSQLSEKVAEDATHYIASVLEVLVVMGVAIPVQLAASATATATAAADGNKVSNNSGSSSSTSTATATASPGAIFKSSTATSSSSAEAVTAANKNPDSSSSGSSSGDGDYNSDQNTNEPVVNEVFYTMAGFAKFDSAFKLNDIAQEVERLLEVEQQANERIVLLQELSERELPQNERRQAFKSLVEELINKYPQLGADPLYVTMLQFVGNTEYVPCTTSEASATPSDAS